MKPIDQWLNEYGVSHQNQINKALHWICVPLITFSLLGMLKEVNLLSLSGLWDISLAEVFILGALVFYLLLSVPLAIGMIFISLVMLGGLQFLNQNGIFPLWQLSLAIFIVAWIGQFIGHKIEGKKPSFFQDILFLLIGPIWLLSFLYKKANLKY